MTVQELREAILKANNMTVSETHTLEITNAQNREIFHLDTFLVQKNSSVIVKRTAIDRYEDVVLLCLSKFLSLFFSVIMNIILLILNEVGNNYIDILRFLNDKP